MAEEIQDAKQVVQDPSIEQKPVTETPSAEDAKTEQVEGKGQEGQKEASQEPWHKDPRFHKFLEEKKELEEARKSYDALSADPDFATFIAFKRNKEAMQAKEEKQDFSKMSAEEYAEYVANQSREAARAEYENLVNANKQADVATKEAISFAGQYGVNQSDFEKTYGPQIVAHYESVSKKIGEDKIDAYIMANPPKEVFKSLYFDKATEAGVKKYKDEVETAKKAQFETEGQPASSGKPQDFRSSFDENWDKFYGKTESLPLTALNRK